MRASTVVNGALWKQREGKGFESGCKRFMSGTLNLRRLGGRVEERMAEKPQKEKGMEGGKAIQGAKRWENGEAV